MKTTANAARIFRRRAPRLGNSDATNSMKFHRATTRPLAAPDRTAIVFSRRIGGITSALWRLDGRASASFFCRNSNQDNSYIATATANISHSLFAHETSSQSSVLYGADGKVSRDSDSVGKDKGAGGRTRKDINEDHNRTNIPNHRVGGVVVVKVAEVAKVAKVAIIAHSRVSNLSGQSRNLFLAPPNTQHLVSHTLPRICVRFRQFYLCGCGRGQRVWDFLHPHRACVSSATSRGAKKN